MKTPMIRLFVAVTVLALVSAACGDDTADTETTKAATATTTPTPDTTTPSAPDTTTPSAPDSTTPAPPGDATELTIGAEDNEGFTRDVLQAPVGEITVTFENKDLSTGEPHNWHLITDFGEWATLVREAPDTQSVTFTIDTPGEYEFFCDTHIEAMKGNLLVTP